MYTLHFIYKMLYKWYPLQNLTKIIISSTVQDCQKRKENFFFPFPYTSSTLDIKGYSKTELQQKLDVYLLHLTVYMCAADACLYLQLFLVT